MTVNNAQHDCTFLYQANKRSTTAFFLFYFSEWGRIKKQKEDESFMLETLENRLHSNLWSVPRVPEIASWTSEEDRWQHEIPRENFLGYITWLKDKTTKIQFSSCATEKKAYSFTSLIQSRGIERRCSYHVLIKKSWRMWCWL